MASRIFEAVVTTGAYAEKHLDHFSCSMPLSLSPSAPKLTCLVVVGNELDARDLLTIALMDQGAYRSTYPWHNTRGLLVQVSQTSDLNRGGIFSSPRFIRARSAERSALPNRMLTHL